MVLAFHPDVHAENDYAFLKAAEYGQDASVELLLKEGEFSEASRLAAFHSAVFTGQFAYGSPADRSWCSDTRNSKVFRGMDLSRLPMYRFGSSILWVPAGTTTRSCLGVLRL